MWQQVVRFVSDVTSPRSSVPPETQEILSAFRPFTCLAYDPENLEHEATLHFYWDTVWPEEPFVTLPRCGAHWKKLGFQGRDPASDFRGSGIFGLRCLVYMALRYPSTFRSMYDYPITEQQGRYPFSIAGLNMLLYYVIILSDLVRDPRLGVQAETFTASCCSPPDPHPL